MKNTIVLVSLLANSSAGEWPGWRGPTGDGVVSDEKAPLEWSIEKDVNWKVKIPGKGHASPIIWGDELFLVSADEDSGSQGKLFGKKLYSNHLSKKYTAKTAELRALQ